MSEVTHVDIVVIGSGPAGQTAAIQGTKAGKRVVMIERELGVGGACVHRGTIPSKTLRETAVNLASLRERTGGMLDVHIPPEIKVETLMSRLETVVRGHVRVMDHQLRRAGVELWHGRASFTGPKSLRVLSPSGKTRDISAETIVIAVGSRPRAPANVPIDHEFILDSDSVLSMIYLPASLTVLGGGVIASEYASIFQILGVKVTMIDKAPLPLTCVDSTLSERFVRSFEEQGGTFLGGRSPASVEWDGLSAVVTTLDDGTVVKSDKLLCALGRVSNVEGLNMPVTGVKLSDRGLIVVDEFCQTCVPGIYAVGDVIGPPSLASSSMEQGRRAVRHSLGLDLGHAPEMIPIGIYTVPEISSVGLSETDARKVHGEIILGRASFSELARGQISAIRHGMLTLVADAAGKKLLGAQIIGDGATEIIHVAQMALLAGDDVDVFIDHIFNFPTLAEGYRVAALEIVKQREFRAADAERTAPVEPAAV